MPTHKYHGVGRNGYTGPDGVAQEVDQHRGPLSWPGTEAGFPFRGQAVPNLKSHEQDQIQHVLDYHSFRFELWREEHRRAFDLLMDRVSNGWYQIMKRQDQWVRLPVKTTLDSGDEVECEMPYLVVQVEWVQIYGEMASGKMPSIS